MADARHGSVVTTKLYMSGCETLRVLTDRYGGTDILQLCPPYLPIFVENLGLFEKCYHNLKMNSNQVGLFELAEWFLFTLVGINKDNFETGLLSVTELIDEVTNYVPTKFAGKSQTTKIVKEEELSELLTNKLKLSNDAITEIMTHVTAISTEKASVVANDLGGIIQRQKLTQEGLIELDNTALTEGVTIIDNAQPVPLVPLGDLVIAIPKKKPMPLFLHKKDYQQLFKNENNISLKLNIIIDAVNDAKQQTSNGAALPAGYREWLYRVGKITICIETCYGGCNNKFLLNRTKLLSSQYKCPHGKSHRFNCKRNKKKTIIDNTVFQSI